MQTSLLPLVIAENDRIQQLSAKSDPRLLSQSHSHLRNLIRAMEKSEPGDIRYKLALTTLYQYDKNELDHIQALYNKQWEDVPAQNNYVEALKNLQCMVGRAVAFLT